MSFISVIIPVYNTEKYLKKSIESVLHQTYEELEVILVDDGSTDGSPAICDQFERDDVRVRVIHKKHGGLSSARNVGIEIATGEFIAFVDSDDYLMPNMYAKMLSEMKASEADIVMCSLLNINDKGCYLGKTDIREWIGSGIEFLGTDGLVYNYAWNKLYRREIFDGIRFPDGKYFEDMFVMHDIFIKARKISIIPDALYVYQRREGSISIDLASYHRVDLLDALVRRMEILLNIDAEEKAIFYYIMQIYSVWNHFYLAGMLKESFIAAGWKTNYTRFRFIAKGISKKWTSSHKLQLFLLRLHPQLLRLFFVNNCRIDRILLFFKRSISRITQTEIPSECFLKTSSVASQLPENIYELEYKKYKSALKVDDTALIVKRMEAFQADDIVLKENHLILSDDPRVPTVVLVVRNELERIKLFYDHYHKLGVHQFVVLDNDSDDGTIEYLLEQSDTRIYQTSTKFQTQKKEGWIEKLLVKTGYHRWYIVVDSDELLDYIGSENHSVENLIRKVDAAGLKRICGYMLDMYAKEPLFSDGCESDNIPKHFRYFDKEWYYTKGHREHSNNCILGGPRLRMFGTAVVVSKQAIFYFDEHTLYENCHELLPVIPISEMPTLFVLRHYKFLEKDYEEYQRRVREKAFFRDSIEYQTIMEQLQKNGKESMFYYESCEYINSDSLRCLPYLEEVIW